VIAQIFLSALLCGILMYAWVERRLAPIVGFLVITTVVAGLYLVWVPSHATRLAEAVGIGRGVDLVIYTWVVISLLVVLNLHLKLRAQTEAITTLARAIALAGVNPSPEGSVVPREPGNRMGGHSPPGSDLRSSPATLREKG
jgi:small membrane protein